MSTLRIDKIALSLIILGTLGLWLLADTFIISPITYFGVRAPLVQLTGALAIVAMSACLILAARYHWIDRALNGLDKAYRLHKWLGITAFIAALTHWYWAKGTKWLVQLGLLARPEHIKREIEPGTLEHLLLPVRDFSEISTELAFYAVAVLLVLSLVKRFPYRLFIKSHKLLALFYVAFAFHAIVLARTTYWTQPIGVLLALSLAAGVFSSVWILLKRHGATLKVKGSVVNVEHYPDAHFVQAEMEMDKGWRSHQPGQFAFLTVDRLKEAHPFTIMSSWDEASNRLTFLIKILGDHTKALYDTLRVGDSVTVEGPYGAFTFDKNEKRQIWIGAGIGITPFVARMKYLAKTPHDNEIDFFHPTRFIPDTGREKLEADAKAANVRAYVSVDGVDGFLSGEKIRTKVKDWKTADVWFCGPAKMGDMIRKDLIAHGLPARAFHREAFEMR